MPTNILQACHEGNLNVVIQCVRRGEKPDVRDNQKSRTALMWAIINNHKEVIRYLLDSGLELNLAHTDVDGLTALEHTKKCIDQEIFEMINAFNLHQKFPVIKATENVRSNCSWQYVRTQLTKVGESKITDENQHETRIPIISETLHLTLEHHSRKTRISKWQLPVGNIHHQLRTDLRLFNNTDGNMLAVDITFEIKVEGEAKRQHITFPLKVPGVKMFNMSDANRFVQQISPTLNAYSVLAPIYDIGVQSRGNVAPHGYQIKYDGSSYDKGYANHSEQALIAYLSTPQAAQMLVTRLRSEMRSQNIGTIGTRVKVDSLTLHIHSNKTTCGPCESALVGMQMSRTQNMAARGQYYGLNEQLEAHLLQDQAVYHFYLPTKIRNNKQAGLRCQVTFSADSKDATHTHEYTRNKTLWSDREPTKWDTSTQQFTNKIPIALFTTQAFHAGNAGIELNDRTIFTSASDVNPTTPRKKATYRRLSDEHEMDLSETFNKVLKL